MILKVRNKIKQFLTNIFVRRKANNANILFSKSRYGDLVVITFNNDIIAKGMLSSYGTVTDNIIAINNKRETSTITTYIVLKNLLNKNENIYFLEEGTNVALYRLSKNGLELINNFEVEYNN